jgi:hypothetical protein
MKIRVADGKKLLVMSRSEWKKIGSSTKWLKTAEPIETDGKWYDEVNGELVEIPNPNLIKDITVIVHGVPYLFEVGKTYADHAGKYIVEEIKNKGQTLKVKYIDGRFQGETREYPTIDRAKIMWNEAVRQDQQNRFKTMGFSGNQEYFAIGYLAKNGFVNADVPPSERKWFEGLYKQLTGDDAVQYLGTAAYGIVKEESKWHLELRIGFPEADDAILSRMLFKNVNNITRPKTGGLKINNNDFVFNLFKIGFKLGRQDVEVIKSHIPEKYMGDFNAGVSA